MHGAPSSVPLSRHDFIIDLKRGLGKDKETELEHLFDVTKETLLKHRQVAQDASLMGTVRSICVYHGVEAALRGVLNLQLSKQF